MSQSINLSLPEAVIKSFPFVSTEVKDHRYIGCFIDNYDGAGLQQTYYEWGLTVNECISTCIFWGTKYAGISVCFTGSQILAAILSVNMRKETLKKQDNKFVIIFLHIQFI